MIKYEHIFFDLDHTLWDFKTNSRNALEQLHEEFILLRSPKLKFNDFYYRYVEVNDHWWQQYRMGKVGKQDLRGGRFRDTLQHFGITDEVLTETLAHEYTARSPYQTTLFPGAIETLETLVERGHILHIITNGFEEVQHIKLSESKLRTYFDQVITSEMVKARKPEPQIFDHAFKLSGAKPSESLMIGDSLIADIRGAELAGMDQVYFNPEGNKHDYSPTYEIRELEEMLELKLL